MFKTFSVEKFLCWFAEHNADWQEQHVGEEIKDLQRRRRWESYQLAEYYQERRDEIHVPLID
jgi:hypothetical protein